MVHTPVGDEGSISHVSLLDGVSRSYPHELSHQSVEHIGIVVGFIRLPVGQQSEFHHLFIGHIIKSVEVGPCLLDGVAMLFESVAVHPRQQLSAAMSETLMQVGMQVVCHITVSVDEFDGVAIDDKLFLKSISFGCLCIGFSEVSDSDALTSVLRPYPVGIRQIDTYGC